MELSAAGVRVARADGAAGPDGRQPAGAAPGRGLGRLGAVRGRARASVSATAPACCRTSPSSTTSPTSCRSPTAAPGWTTSTSTSWPGSSATRRPSTPGPCRSSSRRCATGATSSAAPTASYRLSPQAMRQLGKALLRDVAQRMSGRQGQRELRQAGRRGRPVGRDPRVGSSATPSRGTSPRTHRATRVRRTAAEGGDPTRPASGCEIGDVEVAGDRGPHPGRGRAAGRHVVLDGDGRPLGADEADRAGAAHLIRSRFRGDAAAADRLRPARRR